MARVLPYPMSSPPSLQTEFSTRLDQRGAKMAMQPHIFSHRLRSRVFLRGTLAGWRSLVNGATGTRSLLKRGGGDNVPRRRLHLNGRSSRGCAPDVCDPLIECPQLVRRNMMFPASNPLASRTFVELLQSRAEQHGARAACTFLTDGESAAVTYSYADLDQRARRIGGWLQAHGATGRPVLAGVPARSGFRGRLLWLPVCRRHRGPRLSATPQSSRWPYLLHGVRRQRPARTHHRRIARTNGGDDQG